MSAINRQSALARLHRAGIVRAAKSSLLAASTYEGRLRSHFDRGTGNRTGTKTLTIAAFTPSYIPEHPGGSEITLHCVLREMVGRGHRAIVRSDSATHSRVIDGVEILSRGGGSSSSVAKRADVIVGQLKALDRPLRLGARLGKPVVYYFHIANTPREFVVGMPDLTLFSSEFTRQKYRWIEHAMVVHPPIFEREYLTTPGDCITLVNLTELKGGQHFFDLATKMPEREFLGVRGWGQQVDPPSLPPNVTIMDSQDDAREIYRRTRVLLLPSSYESYGRVAIEAAVSGIPTIAHPSPGVIETMEDAALWADRDDVGAWVRRVHELDDPEAYGRWSRAARARFDSLDPQTELDRLEAALLGLAGKYAVQQ